MRKAIVTVSIDVEVTLDETTFTPEFFEEFNANFYDFGDDLGEHQMHLAQLAARGIINDGTKGEFIEGYGPQEEMGIGLRLMSWREEVTEPEAA